MGTAALGGNKDNQARIDELLEYIDTPRELKASFIQVVRKGELIGLAEGANFIFKVEGPYWGQRLTMSPAGVPGLIGKNVALEFERSDELVALCDGQLLVDGGKISVEPLVEIEGDLDFRRETVELEGSILIRGDVRQSLKLRSGRDAEVCGTLEGAAIVAKGDVYIGRGAFGGESGYIQARGNVFLRHCQQMKVVSMGHIFVYGSALYCNLAASKSVKILGDGVMIGGSARAGQSVELMTAGSEAVIPTLISAGEDPIIALRMGRLRAQLKESKRRAREAQKNASFLISKLGLCFPDSICDPLSKTIYLLEGAKSHAEISLNKNEGLQKLAHLFFGLLNAEEEIEHISKKLLSLQNKEKFYPEAKVKIARRIYPGVSVRVCGLTERVDYEQDGSIYWAGDEEIKKKAT